jgi:hypothetical protein
VEGEGVIQFGGNREKLADWLSTALICKFATFERQGKYPFISHKDMMNILMESMDEYWWVWKDSNLHSQA